MEAYLALGWHYGLLYWSKRLKCPSRVSQRCRDAENASGVKESAVSAGTVSSRMQMPTKNDAQQGRQDDEINPSEHSVRNAPQSTDPAGRLRTASHEQAYQALMERVNERSGQNPSSGSSIGRCRDFTDGSARVQYVYDGFKYCGGLLLTQELSAIFVKAIQHQRKLVQVRAQTERQLAEVARIQQETRSKIAEKTLKILDIEEGYEEGKGEEDLLSLRAEMNILQKMEENMEISRSDYQSRENHQAGELGWATGDVVECREGILLKAGMIGPADEIDEAVTVYDHDTEYQKAFAALYPQSPAPSSPGTAPVL